MIGAPELAPLRSLAQLSTLHIDAKSVAPNALKDLVNNLPIEYVQLWLSDGVEEAHVLAFDSANATHLRLFGGRRPVPLSAATMTVLAKKRISQLHVQYEDASDAQFERIGDLKTLEIRDSKVDDQVVEQLARASQLETVQFSNCRFVDSVFDELPKLPELGIEIHNESAAFEKSDLKRLAVTPRYGSIKIQQPNLDEFFAAEFRRIANLERSGDKMIEVEIKGTRDAYHREI